jgi:hypothetical protein
MIQFTPEALDKLKNDLLMAETYLNAQGLPWLAHQVKNAYRICLRADVQDAIKPGPE